MSSLVIVLQAGTSNAVLRIQFRSSLGPLHCSLWWRGRVAEQALGLKHAEAVALLASGAVLREPEAKSVSHEATNADR